MSNLEQTIDPRTRISDDAGVSRSRTETTLCTVYSNHPLAFRTIANAISSDPNRNIRVNPYSGCKATNGLCQEILVLDTCSVPGWQEPLSKWHSEGGRVLALVLPDAQAKGELRMLALGVAGVVRFSDDLSMTLPNAIEAVREGNIWASREALDEYLRRTNVLLRHLSSMEHFLTVREQQIIDLLREGLSNKQISSILGISERTAKFHVSNLLKKWGVENRWAFLTEDVSADQATDQSKLAIMNMKKNGKKVQVSRSPKYRGVAG